MSQQAYAAAIICLDIARYDPHFAAGDPGIATSSRFGAFYLEQSTNPGGYDRWGPYTDWANAQGLKIYSWRNQWQYWIYENFWIQNDQAAQYTSIADFLNTSSEDWSHLCWAFVEGNLDVGGVAPDTFADMCEDLWLYAYRYWKKPITGIRSYQVTDSETYKTITRGDNLIYWMRDLYHLPRPVIPWWDGAIMAALYNKKKRKRRYGVNARNRSTGGL